MQPGPHIILTPAPPQKIINSSLMPQLPEFMAYPRQRVRGRETEREREKEEDRALQG